MRPALYSGVSTALAGGVVAYAFAQRPNFYSACVFLSQSNLSLMILINLCFIIAFTVVWGLSRLLYGRLRPVEVEQLYERGWFAVTETCLAMTIFRDEIGAWFISMFVALMAGRVWGWIAHGRVEILEQQPPSNPRTFHTRLTLALLVALVYNYAFVSYAAGIVYEQARPNMMVMFLFEHVLLTITTVSTALKYLLCAIEIRITQTQTQQMLEARRAEIRERRGEMVRQREAAAERGDEVTGRDEPLPSENDVEEMDIEAPGWEGKGQFVLLLELLSDFMRLLVYLAFFAVLSTFFGLPIHIMRDLFVTTRSFIKRLNAVLRYRSATKDMNAKYPDATAAEIAGNDTCIVCREEMRPWIQVNRNAGRTLPGNQPTRPAIPMSEGKRAKKLPCGHILHMVCLKSWLERAQVCPTCRAPVNGRAAQPAAAQQAAAPGRALGPGGQPHPLGNRAQGQQPAAANNGRGGIINLGRFQVAYGRAADPVAAAEAARAAVMAQARTPLRTQGPAPLPSPATFDIGELIRRTEQRIMEEAARLESQREDLVVLKRMQQELSRLRTADREQRDQRQEEQPTATTFVPPVSYEVNECQEEQPSATPSAPTASSTVHVVSPSPKPTDEAMAAVVTDGSHSSVGQADNFRGTEAEDQRLPASSMEDNAQEGTNSFRVGGSSISTASSISHQHSAPSTDGAGPSSSHTAPTATSGEGGDIAPSDGTINLPESHRPHFDGLAMGAEQPSSNDVGNAVAGAMPNQATSTNAENAAADGEIPTTSSADSADENGLQRS